MIKYILFDWGGTLANSGTRNNFIYGNKKQKLLSLYPDTIVTLKYLHAQGYILGIVSNTEHDAQDMYKALSVLGLHKLFKCIVYSNDPDMCEKPCDKIYYTALNCLSNHHRRKISTNEVLFVGNNYEKDIVAPHRLGMYTAFLPCDPYYQKPQVQDILLTKISDLMYYL